VIHDDTLAGCGDMLAVITAGTSRLLTKRRKLRNLRKRTEASMVTTRGVSATEFSRNFARYRDEAIEAKIIYVTSHGRVIGAYLSASEAAHYEQLKRRERQTLVVGDLPDDVVAAIEAAEYGVEAK